MLVRTIILLLAFATLAAAQECTLRNPTKRAYKDELLRLKFLVAADQLVVKEDGVPIPYQLEPTEGKYQVWIRSDFAPESSHTYQVAAGRSGPFAPRVRLVKQAGFYLLDNGLVAVRLPAEAPAGIIPGPIAAIRLGERWVGASSWKTSLPLKAFRAEVLCDGTLLAKVHLRYFFEGMAGIDGDAPAHADVCVTLGAGWNHAEIIERHEMARGDYWEFDASRGWSPRQGVSQPFSSGAGSGLVGGRIQPRRDLKPGGLPYCREDLFINFLPRWNQHYKDGWCFAATDGQQYVGAVAVSASQWIWPHNNAIEALVKPSGDYAGLRCPTWKGQRLWWLFAPTLIPADLSYITRHAWESLDKLNHDFILTWPGKSGSFAGMNFYDGNQVNPTSAIRGQGRRAIADAGKPGNLSTLYRVQVMMHADAYGSYGNFFSPENPNFYTDFFKVPIALTANLRSHPRFEELRKMAEMKLREDLEHSVTLPGGAGQECPGYESYALRNWTELAKVCREYLGFDPTTWERYRAALYFQKRITQPDGNVRRMLPIGDTHPSRSGGPAIVAVPLEEVRKFKTEELPGFGAIFTHNPGTPQETYLAFKSGPNRGHYHGDQLSFHYCANAKPLAIDHHCSYHPRAGQEHMHNRVAFGTDQFPFANMDGYERLIAFKTSPSMDIAVGQVESDRLRQVEKLPPEIWHQEYPQHAFQRPLVYRRTIVFLKGQPQDYFVIRDQFWASEPLSATYCLHVLSDRMDRAGRTIDFGNLSLYVAQPADFQFDSLPWSHDNGGTESTQGARIGMRADHGQFITVLYPGKLPPVTTLPGGVKVGQDQITFSGDQPTAGDSDQAVKVTRAGQAVLSLSGKEIDLNRSQGDIGLFVPDAGYPFGEIPDWLIRQRVTQRKGVGR